MSSVSQPGPETSLRDWRCLKGYHQHQLRGESLESLECMAGELCSLSGHDTNLDTQYHTGWSCTSTGNMIFRKRLFIYFHISYLYFFVLFCRPAQARRAGWVSGLIWCWRFIERNKSKWETSTILSQTHCYSQYLIDSKYFLLPIFLSNSRLFHGYTW